MTLIESKIAGIPCLIKVEHFSFQKGNPSCFDVSDWDTQDYLEFNYKVCDRRGYKADWLQKKMSHQDIEYVENSIIQAHTETY